MRIAVFHNLPSGGAKRALYSSVKHLVDAGHTVDAFVPDTADESYLPLMDVAASARVFPVRKTALGLIRSAALYVPPINYSLADIERTHREIAGVIDESGYDVVLTEQDKYTYSPFILRYLNTPSAYFCQQPSRYLEAALRLHMPGAGARGDADSHGIRMKQERFIGKKTAIDKRNASAAKYILANSFFSRENILRSYGMNSFVSYLGVDSEFFKPSGVPRENFVLSVGSCSPAKGFDFIIRSLALIESKSRPSLKIISNYVNDEWKTHLVRAAGNLRVELEIISMAKDEDILDHYNRAAAFVYSPILEPFGLAPLEAMACETPVVAVREGGVRETVFHGDNGLLTERREDLFSEAVLKIVSNKQYASDLGSNGLDSIRNFWTLKHAGERLLSHLERAASQ